MENELKYHPLRSVRNMILAYFYEGIEPKDILKQSAHKNYSAISENELFDTRSKW